MSPRQKQALLTWLNGVIQYVRRDGFVLDVSPLDERQLRVKMDGKDGGSAEVRITTEGEVFSLATGEKVTL